MAENEKDTPLDDDEVNSSAETGEGSEVNEANSADEEVRENWREEMRAEGASEEDIKRMEKFLSHTSFYANPVNRDKSAEGKAAMKGETIITDDGSEISTVDAHREDVLNLNASAHARRILEGRIISVRPAGETATTTNLAVIGYGHGTVQVYIPDYLMLNFDVKENRTPEKQEKIKNQLIRMIGTRIKFIVKQYDQPSNTAYADRLKAMEQEFYNNYQRPLRGTGKPRIQVGKVVRGTVTSVATRSVTVNVCGVESKIYQDPRKGLEASWYHIEDLRKVFQKNQLVNVKILSVQPVKVEKYGEQYVLGAAELSIRQCEEDPQVKYFNNYKVGQYCEFTVTAVNETDTGVYGILTNGTSKVDCLAGFPRYSTELPRVGDIHTVRITQMSDKTEDGSAYEKDGRLVRRILGTFVDM